MSIPFAGVLSCLLLFVPQFSLAQGVVVQQFKGLTSDGIEVPDPHGAVGPDGILATVNHRMAYFPKLATPPVPGGDVLKRTPLWTVSLAGAASFFGTTGTGYTGMGVADSKAVFDPASGRFFVIQQENPVDRSFLNVAVSRDSSPATPTSAHWRFYRFEITYRHVPPVGPEIELGGDYPGLAVYPTALVVSYNLSELDEVAGLNGPSGKGVEFIAIDKAALIDGTVNPNIRIHYDLDTDDFTAMAVQPIGTDQPQDLAYFIETDETAFLDEAELRLHAIVRPLTDALHVEEEIDVDKMDPATPAPHPGSGQLLGTLSPRAMSAVWVDGRIWVVWTQQQEDSNHAVVRWAKLRPFPTVLEADGSIDGGDGVFSFMPAIGANRRGDVCIVFTRSSSTMNPTVCYTLSRPGGQFSPAQPILTSQEPPNFPQGGNGRTFARWGDYAMVCADPADDTFWVVSEIVNSGGLGDWGTWWAQISPDPLFIRKQPPDAAPFDFKTDLSPELVTFTGVPGSVVTLSIETVGGTSPLTFEWFKNGNRIAPGDRGQISQQPLVFGEPGATSQCVFNSSRYSDEGDYYVTVRETSRPDFVLTSRKVRLQLHPYPEWSLIQQTALVADGVEVPFIYSGGAMAYDEQRNVTVLFGGDQSVKTGSSFGRQQNTNLTWEWNGSVWTKRIPPVSPPIRRGHTLIYDSHRQKLVLFGGWNTATASPTYYNDVWEYDGATWQNRTPASLPSTWPAGRMQQAACYDPVRQRLLVVAGYGKDNLPNRSHADFWLWDGDAGIWTTGANPPYFWSNGSAVQQMTFDPGRQVAVLFGGFFIPATPSPQTVLEWDGTSWAGKGRPFANAPFVSNAADGTSAYDPYKKEILVTTSIGTTADVAAYWWNGRRFLRAVPTPYPNSFGTYFSTQSVNPARFSGSLLVYDSVRRTFVHQTRDFTSPNVSVTAELRFLDRPAFYLPVPPVQLALGGTLILTPGTTSLNRYGLWVPPVTMTYQWFRNDQVLANDGRITGAASPNLMITGMMAGDFGTYRLVATDPSGSYAISEAIVGPMLVPGQTLAVAGLTPGLSFSLTWGAGLQLERSTDLLTWVPVAGAASPFAVYFSEGPMAFYRVVLVTP